MFRSKYLAGIGTNTVGLGLFYFFVYANLYLWSSRLSEERFGSLQMFLAAAFILATLLMGGLQSYLAINFIVEKQCNKGLMRRITKLIIQRYVILFFCIGLAVLMLQLDVRYLVICTISLGIMFNLLVDSVFINLDNSIYLAVRRFLPEFSVFFSGILLLILNVNLSVNTVLLIYLFNYVFIGLVMQFVAVVKIKKMAVLSEHFNHWHGDLLLQKKALPYLVWTLIQASIGRGSIIFVGLAFGSSLAGFWRLFQVGIQGAQAVASTVLQIIVPREAKKISKQKLLLNLRNKTIIISSLTLASFLSIIIVSINYYYLIPGLQIYEFNTLLNIIISIFLFIFANTYSSIVSVLLHWSHEVRAFLRQQFLMLLVVSILFSFIFLISIYKNLSDPIVIILLMYSLFVAKLISTINSVLNLDDY